MRSSGRSLSTICLIPAIAVFEKGEQGLVVTSSPLRHKHISAYNLFMRRKRGTLIPIEQSILDAALHLRSQGEEEFYGFLLAKKIKEKKKARLLTAHGTLYRALMRLEKMGLLRSRWEDPLIAANRNRPRRKMYMITPAGAAEIAKSTEGTNPTNILCWATPK